MLYTHFVVIDTAIIFTSSLCACPTFLPLIVPLLPPLQLDELAILFSDIPTTNANPALGDKSRRPSLFSALSPAPSASPSFVDTRRSVLRVSTTLDTVSPQPPSGPAPPARPRQRVATSGIAVSTERYSGSADAAPGEWTRHGQTDSSQGVSDNKGSIGMEGVQKKVNAVSLKSEPDMQQVEMVNNSNRRLISDKEQQDLYDTLSSKLAGVYQIQSQTDKPMSGEGQLPTMADIDQIHREDSEIQRLIDDLATSCQSLPATSNKLGRC